MAGERVLVTGGSGFVGGHCIIQLLERGHEVRSTVRNIARADKVRAALVRAMGVDPGAHLSFAEADLDSDAGWDAAIAGCAYVHHVASPFPATIPKDENELIIPARDGAVRVVRAAARAGVKRLVMTSSIAAVAYGPAKPDGYVFTETDWTDATHPDAGPYQRSKVIAERAAFAAAREGGLEIATINPGAILGPPLGSDLSTSIELVRRPMAGKMPGAPRISYNLVDVRDVADAHMRAMTADGAAGERFIVAGGVTWVREILEILARRYPERAIRTNQIPDIALRTLALFDPVLRAPTRQIGKCKTFDTSRAERILGWRARDKEVTVVDTAAQLIALKLV
jgi:dihydroflavonol-4-reductase